MRLILAFVCLATALPGAWPQQPAAPIRVGIDYVYVDVIVTDRNGEPVRDLKASDFEVFEEGRPQKIETFALFDAPYDRTPPASRSVVPRVERDVRANMADAAGRVYVLLLDDLHVSPARTEKVRSIARTFIEQYLGPNDLAAVVHTSGRSDVTQDLTPHRALLKKAADAFMGRRLRSSVLERLDEYQRQLGAPTEADARMTRVADPLDAERAHQARRLLESLQGLGDLFARAPGRRKAVVLISEGIEYDLAMGTGQTASGVSTFVNDSAPDLLRAMQEAIRAAAQANVTIYGIDPRGLATGGDDLIETGAFPSNPQLGLTPGAVQDAIRRAQDSLRTLSEQTGGRAAVGTNDPTAVLDRIVRDNSTYYILGYAPSAKKADGKFKSIDVKVSRPGVEVRARKGYVAAAPKTSKTRSLDSESSAVIREALDAPLPVSDLPFRVFAAPFPGGKKTSVVIGLEVDGRALRFERQGDVFKTDVEAAVVAIDDRAKVQAGDRQTIALGLREQNYKAVTANGLRLLFRLEVPPGRYQFRAAMYDSGSRSVGTVFYELNLAKPVDGFQTSGVLLTHATAAYVPTPRPDPKLGMLPAPPTGRRTFSAGDTVTAYLQLHGGNKAGAVQVATTLRDDEGRVTFSATREEAANGTDVVIAVPLAEAAPGDYVLRIEAKPAAGAPVVHEIPLRVTGAAPAK